MRLPPHRYAAPATPARPPQPPPPAPPASAAALAARAAAPRRPLGHAPRRSPAPPRSPPRARCHESDQSDKLGGRGGGGPHASRRLRAGQSPTRRLAPAPFRTAPHTLPRVRAKKKIQVSPPPIFSFLFSLSFVPLSHSHSLLQSEMPRDSPSSRFRVTCPLFSPGLSFLLFPRGAEKWGRNPFCPFPSPDLFHKTRVRFLLCRGLLTFILT